MSDDSSESSSSSSSEEVKKKKSSSSSRKSEDASKKRKRDDTESNATAHREAQLTWEVPSFGSKSKSDKDASSSLCPPLIASFPLGPPPKSLLTAEDEDDRLQFRLFTNQKDVSLDDGMDVDAAAPCSAGIFEDWSARWNTSSRQQSTDSSSDAQTKKTELRVSAPNHRIEYVGKDYGETSTKNDSAKFALGVLNKRTNTIQFVPIPSIYSMEQSIVGYEPKMPADLSHLSKLEQRRIRAKDVNNRRAQLSIERLISNALTDKNTFALDTAALNMAAAERENTTEDGQPKSRPDLPRYDLSADSPADIFQLEDVVPQEHLHLLGGDIFRKALDDSKLVHKLDKVDKKMFDVFSFSHPLLLYMTSAKGSKQKIADKASLVQYLYFMIVMYRHASKARHHTIRYPEKDPAASNLTVIPRQLVVDMLAEFTEIPSDVKNPDTPLYHFPKVKLDKLVNYICILSLTLHGYKLAMNQLAVDLDMPPRESVLDGITSSLMPSSAADLNHSFPPLFTV
eukprot:TRINITY_DN492_c0_g1_i1.p1 TRINITY_DN492_c0_g1~~TRINITY_DN492_c0_g1_i1.p1  ORF type:complete len:511 (+),score=127.71 TRINITY_DN492_c0_g1_i1:388-1920(+)